MLVRHVRSPFPSRLPVRTRARGSVFTRCRHTRRLPPFEGVAGALGTLDLFFRPQIATLCATPFRGKGLLRDA
jgi:hypothetical protein